MPKVAANRTGEPIAPPEEEVGYIQKYAEIVEDSAFFEEMPPTLAHAMRLVLAELSAGHAIAVVPYNRELTTQQAAELLGVSRPYLVGLLERGELRYRMVGSHRRIPLEELLAYREARSDERRRILRNLTQEGQRLGLELPS